MKNRDIGFMLIKMYNSPMYDFILKSIRSCIDDNPFNHIVIFNSYCDRIDTMGIPILHLNQAKFFNGDLFMFDLISIILSKNFTNINTKYFYAQDIPWTLNKTTRYFEWYNIFNETKLEIIAKNQEIYDSYNICWKKPLCITERFEYEELKNSI